MLYVCGVTFDQTMNYGSCLQAFALQTVIEKQELSSGEKCKYSLLPLQKSLLPKKTGVQGFREKTAVLLRGMFSKFEKQRMHYVTCDSLNTLRQLNSIYDAFVCGSDVIWNPQFNRGFDAYYLQFAEKYAFSYAASFGRAQLSTNEIKNLPTLLSKIRNIGVRERKARELIEQYTGRKSTIVLDPVLLLCREYWDQIAIQRKRRLSYIFVYCTHFSPELIGFCNKLKGVTNCRIIIVTTGFINSIKAKTIHMPTPPDWLRLIRDAKYVVTNSFHATAFSVIYHKKFFTVMHGTKSGGINVRMYDFLNEIGLGDRLLNEVPEKIDTGEIDYSEVDVRLDNLRVESLAFLRKNLDIAYREKLERKG